MGHVVCEATSNDLFETFHWKGSPYNSRTCFLEPSANHPLHVGSYTRPIFEEMVQHVDIIELRVPRSNAQYEWGIYWYYSPRRGRYQASKRQFFVALIKCGIDVAVLRFHIDLQNNER